MIKANICKQCKKPTWLWRSVSGALGLVQSITASSQIAMIPQWSWTAWCPKRNDRKSLQLHSSVHETIAQHWYVLFFKCAAQMCFNAFQVWSDSQAKFVYCKSLRMQQTMDPLTHAWAIKAKHSHASMTTSSVHQLLKLLQQLWCFQHWDLWPWHRSRRLHLLWHFEWVALSADLYPSWQLHT